METKMMFRQLDSLQYYLWKRYQIYPFYPSEHQYRLSISRFAVPQTYNPLKIVIFIPTEPFRKKEIRDPITVLCTVGLCEITNKNFKLPFFVKYVFCFQKSNFSSTFVLGGPTKGARFLKKKYENHVLESFTIRFCKVSSFHLNFCISSLYFFFDEKVV